MAVVKDVQNPGEKSRKRLKVPLTRLVGFGFGGFVAISLALVLILSVTANYKNTFSLLNDKAILATQAMEAQVRNYFDSVERAVVALKPFFDDGILGFDRLDRTLEDMTIAVSTNPALTLLVATDLKGERFGVYKAPNGKIWPFVRDIPSNGEKMYEVPKLPIGSGPKWGALVHNAYGQFANVSVPLVRDGKIAGTLTAASSIAELGIRIQALDDGPNSTIFIIAGDDEVVVHSDLEEFQSGGKAEVTLPAGRGQLGDPVLNLDNEREILPAFGRAAALGIKVSAVEAADGEFLMLSGTIEGYSDKPLIIGQYFRDASVSREVERLAGSTFVSLALLVISVLIAIWVGRRLACPLRNLAEQSERVGALSLSDIDPLPRSRVSELDQVALAFNAMVEGLRAMNTYVPRSLFIKLMRLGGSEAAEAREAELTILFTDIAGFTSLSQNMSASETARHLNEHFAILVGAVEAEGGTVDKFVGDGMLAFWGAPDVRHDHAAAAVTASRRIAAALHEANKEAAAKGLPEVRMRIGIHTGSAVVGNVGALDRWNYTVVGDTVNITDRLQSLGREVAADDEIVILASAETIKHLPQEAAKTPVGSVKLRGRTGEMDVWKLDPFAEPAETADEPLIELRTPAE